MERSPQIRCRTNISCVAVTIVSNLLWIGKSMQSYLFLFIFSSIVRLTRTIKTQNRNIFRFVFWNSQTHNSRMFLLPHSNLTSVNFCLLFIFEFGCSITNYARHKHCRKYVIFIWTGFHPNPIYLSLKWKLLHSQIRCMLILLMHSCLKGK